jgi:hypothetical protein
MKKFIQIPAYIWAVICMLLIPITFMGNNGFAKQLAKLPFMKVNPIYTGGDPDRSYQVDSLTITINKPVFEALIGESTKGFVQVRFSPAGSLPSTIVQSIDFNNDGSNDFYLAINTKTGDTEYRAQNTLCAGLNVSSRVKKDWVVRINLVKE